jgi:endonuclease/exonuclease/phosphatase family metal-dependent hydrolase
MATLRVAAYNVHGFRAGAATVAEALAEEEPDVAILNEVGFLGFRLRRCARLLGMEQVSGLRRIRPVRNAVLARPPWRIVGKHVERLPRHAGSVQRGVVFALARRAGRRLTLGAVHLGLSQRERELHARELTDLLAGVPHPVIFGGDLNEGPDGPASAWIAGRYWDAFSRRGEGEGATFPASEPRARIDYVFVSDGLEIERVWVGTGAGETSDHLPVFADVVVAG